MLASQISSLVSRLSSIACRVNCNIHTEHTVNVSKTDTISTCIGCNRQCDKESLAIVCPYKHCMTVYCKSCALEHIYSQVVTSSQFHIRCASCHLHWNDNLWLGTLKYSASSEVYKYDQLYKQVVAELQQHMNSKYGHVILKSEISKKEVFDTLSELVNTVCGDENNKSSEAPCLCESGVNCSVNDGDFALHHGMVDRHNTNASRLAVHCKLLITCFVYVKDSINRFHGYRECLTSDMPGM